MIKKLKNLIIESLYKNNKPSSSRIFGYIMMFIIFMLGIIHIGIEIGNSIIMWKQEKVYIPSWQSISIIAMWLTHQLTLLGIYKKAETYKDIKQIKQIIKNNIINEKQK